MTSKVFISVVVPLVNVRTDLNSFYGLIKKGRDVMKISMKRVFIPSILVVLFVTAITVIPNAMDSSNNAPTSKVIGSRLVTRAFTEIRIETLSDLVAISDIIVIGKIEKVSGVIEGRMREGEDAPTYIEASYNVIVEETLYGESSEQLTICLLGAPDSDVGMTKPKVGENLILFLSANENGTYAVQGFEKGMFKIMDDKTVVSFSDEQVTAQFDGKTLDFMRAETQKSVREAVAFKESVAEQVLENGE